jgi:hypothetical protein
MRRTHKEIQVDKSLSGKHRQGTGLNLQYLPAATFGNTDMVVRNPAVCCNILPVLEGLFINEFCHDLSV